MKLWKKINKRMETLGMTQKVFCERTGIRQSTVSDWKSKNTNPSTDKILIICKTLDVSPEWLLSEECDKKSTEVKKKTTECYYINKDSEMGMIIEKIERLDDNQYERLIGYCTALEQM